MGNICRSPTAEGVFKHKLRALGIDDEWLVDSAGTHAYHIGEAPDKRSQQAALKRGYALQSIRARQVSEDDFYRFDWILAADAQNLRALKQTAPHNSTATVQRIMDFSEQAGWQGGDVPDPYYGGASGFDDVLDRLESACDGFLATHCRTHD